MPSFLFNKYVIYALVFAGVFMSGYGIAWKNGKDKLNAFTNEQKVLAKAQDKINKEKVERDDKAIADIKTGYNADVVRLRSYYNGMYHTNSSTDNVSKDKPATVRTYATSADLTSDPKVLERECAVTTLMLVDLQDYVKKVIE